MAFPLSQRDSARGIPDAILAGLAGVAVAALGPLAAMAPRGLPVWAILIALVGLAGLARRGALGRLQRAMPGTAVVLAFLALASLSILWSPSPRAGLTVVEIGYIGLGALAGGAWLSSLPGVEARRLTGLFLVGVFVGVLLFAVEAALDFPLHRWWNHVPAGVEIAETNVPKRTAVLLCLMVWPAAMALDRAGRRGLAVALPTVFAAACLLLTSRSAMLGIAVGGVAFALAVWSPRLVRGALAAVLGVAFAFVLPLVLLFDRVLNLDGADWLFRSAQHRVEIWGMAASRALETPFFGQGIDASRALEPEGAVSRFGTLTDSLLPLHPHNAFLQVWLELGAFGAALALAAALLLLLGTGRLERRLQPFALALFASALAMASTAYGIWQAWWMGGMLAAGLMLRLAARTPARGE
ncbi:O-antigen ligase family protein [Azospirillum sp. YIM DDC1]|uniref:O-antigen ligase family protein n=1 Tax=Azospirillum aestuarii TaxID=2802052 RepID=A0ABS1I6S9_9PROT|nr:O-antigen ligase family protein [Azospirillum aestuarii]MBK4722780.1 O-antigen ligase family protein [Azospirillum aestuarii]